MLGGTQNRFSLTRAALNTRGALKQFLIINSASVQLTMKIIPNSSLLLALADSLSATSSYAVTLFESQGFEAPAYGLGSLTGQNGWTSQGTAVATVQNSVVASGSQAVSLSGTATTWHWPSVGYTPASGELIRVNADIRRGSSAATAKNFGYFIDVYDNTAGSRIGRVGIANNAGSLVGIATTKDAGGIAGNYILQSGMQWDTWYNFKMELDFTGQVFDLLIDGTVVGADLPFLITATDFGDADLMLSYTTGATDGGYFDNYSVITVIPEPSSGALFLLGLAGFALRRRQ